MAELQELAADFPLIPEKKPRKFPVEIKAGGSRIQIQRDPLWIPEIPKGAPKDFDKKNAPRKEYDSYLVIHYVGSQRLRKRRSTYEKARDYANEIRIKLLNNQAEATRLAGRDQRIYLAAVENLEGLGKSIDHATKEYADAVKALKDYGLTLPGAVNDLVSALKRLNGKTLNSALDFYELHGRAITSDKTVPEVLKEMLKALKDDRVGDYHRRDLAIRAGHFAQCYPVKIGEITTPQINGWLRGLRSRGRKTKGAEISGTTRNNYRDAVVELFNFAKDHGYLSPDLSTAAERSKVVKAVTAENEIFEPGEMEKLLSTAPPHMVPGMAVKAFTGLRTEEVIVVEWPDIRFERNCIILSKFITKLDQRRIIPLTANLKAWLLPYRRDEGRICDTWTTPNSAAAAWKRHGKSVGVKTGKNKFRNSYISYRVAETNDPKTVAFESGNSEETIKRDYLEVTTPEEAKEWFSIFPSERGPEIRQDGGNAVLAQK
ncbi:MAG: site-specific integrase [Verrucomicrobiota bacterium]